MDIAFETDQLDWQKGNGLLPAVVQHWRDGRVLMLGYMNKAALAMTRETAKVTFYSRSRKRLWTKGETSGNHLRLKAAYADCDRDALLILADPDGPTCHLGYASCFGDTQSLPALVLERLETIVTQRDEDRPEGSYTASLLEKGTRRIAQKVGEEGVETALAAVAEPDSAVLSEAADLLFHLLVLLRARGLSLAQVTSVLQERQES